MPIPQQNIHWGLSTVLARRINPTLLMLADSWGWYPFNNLAVEIGAALRNEDHVLAVIGNNGSESSEWATKYRKDIDTAFKFYAPDAQALVLSGGGNDVAGMKDFLRLINDDCSACKDAAECFRVTEPTAVLQAIEGHYRAVIAKFRAYNKHKPVFVHHYDHAWPTGKGLFGPSDWLAAPMDRAKVREDLRPDVFRMLIERFKQMQESLAADPSLGVVVVPTAGVLPSGEKVRDEYWANELHPTPKGFELLVRDAFGPAFESAGLA